MARMGTMLPVWTRPARFGWHTGRAGGAGWAAAAALTGDAFLEWGWRIPFLFSAVLVLIGLWIRLGVEEAPEFQRIREAGAVRRLPVLEVIKRHPRGLAVTIGLRLVQPASL